MSERLSMQGWVAWALSNGLTADDLGDDVPESIKDAWFYKATRPDGTDFYTGTVDYGAALASGEPLPELPGDDVFPGPG